jgi:hypothetical protein
MHSGRSLLKNISSDCLTVEHVKLAPCQAEWTFCDTEHKLSVRRKSDVTE